MKYIFSLIVITTLLFKYTGQEIKTILLNTSFDFNPVHHFHEDKDYLLIVDGKILKSEYLRVLTPRFITHFEVLKSKEQLKKYGEAGKGGVILVSLKKGTKWIKIKKIFNKNKIPKSLKGLRVVYDENIVDVDSLLIDKATSYKVTVSTSRQGFLALQGKFLLISETFNNDLL